MIPKGHDKTEWKPVTSNSIAYGAYRRVGNVVEINIRCSSSDGISLTGYSDNVIGNLPTGFRPEKNVTVPVFVRTTGGAFLSSIRFDVRTNGNIVLFNWSSTVTVEAIYGYISFMI